MFALCVDDESLTLQALVRAVEKSPDIEGTAAFDDELDALAWAEKNHADIAFLDIELHEMSGIELAKRLSSFLPEISIIFCTGHEKYAIDALRLHLDAGYLVKPFRASQVQEEIDRIRSKKESVDIRVLSPKPIISESEAPAGNTISIRMMGEFSISINGKEDTSLWAKTKKGSVFLEYLILNYGMKVPKKRLTNLFWSDYLYSNPDSALKALVSRLRKALSEIRKDLDGCIVSENGNYSFCLMPDMAIDVLQIQEIFRILPDESDPVIRDKLFRKLLMLYRGDLYLPGDIVDCSALIFDLHSRFLATVHSYTGQLLEQGSYPQVIAYCRKAAQIDPFDESLCMNIMKALQESGRPEDVLKEYRQLRALHKKHLNAEPSEELKKFCRTLLDS